MKKFVFLGLSLLISLALLTVSCHKENLTNNQNNTDTEVPGGGEDPGDEPGGGEGGEGEDPGDGEEETGDHVIPNGVTDADGNQYNTVVLGNQEWMAQSLRVTHYADGTAIPMGTDGQWSDTDPYRYAPAGNEANVELWGYLYNWSAVMHGSGSTTANPSGVQGICPTGWHVPSKAEWEQLFSYVGSQSQYVCDDNPAHIVKSLCVNKDWESAGTGFECCPGWESWSNNATGFSAYPCGTYNGNYMDQNLGAHFWSTTMINVNYKLIAAPRFYCFSPDISGLAAGGQVGTAISLRCVKD